MAPRLASRPAVTLGGHTGAVHALTFSSGSGQYLLSGSSDRTINLYNPAKATGSADTGAALLQTYTGVHGYDVLSLAVAEDNSRFASGGGDKTVFLWDVATARTTRRFGGGAGGHGGRVECVAFGGEGDTVVVSGSFDSTVRFWDAKSQSARPIMVLAEARDSVSSVAVTGHEVHAGSIDGRVRSYDLRMGLLHVDVVAQPVTSVTASMQGDSLLVSSLDSTLRLLDRANGKLLKDYGDARFVNRTYRVRSTLALKDAVALSGAEDGWVYAWDVVTGEVTQRVAHGREQGEQQQQQQQQRASRRVVSAVACKRRGAEWASGGGDGSVVVWSDA